MPPEIEEIVAEQSLLIMVFLLVALGAIRCLILSANEYPIEARKKRARKFKERF